MSGFKALNIESDDESDIEVDDTKEIQIEEALKLYQTALKYHADGPESYEKAAEAYRELFHSEIFKYPESQTELHRIEQFGPSVEYDLPFDGPLPGRVSATTGLDTGPSTLPQVLHLAHKNYAQFKLDFLSARFDDFNVTLSQILVDATSALTHFVNALDKDDTDPDLWRRTASVGELLDSRRVARFCLESVLEGDDEGLGSILALPALAQDFAADQLRELVAQLQDRLSVLQEPLSLSKRRALSNALKQRLYPYSTVIKRTRALREQHLGNGSSVDRKRYILPAPKTWAELGDTLLRQQMAEQHGTTLMHPGMAVSFDLTGVLPPLPPQAQQEEAMQRPRSPKVIIPRVRIAKQTVYPETLTQQFPGLDAGLPTVQPRIASADPSMEVQSDSPADVEMFDSPTMTLPSRKRSGDAAGLHDTDEGRTKSKRLRARDSLVDAAAERQEDVNSRWENQGKLDELAEADVWMFETVSSYFERIGISGFDAACHVRQELQHGGLDTNPPPESLKESMSSLRHARKDIHGLLSQWQEQKAHLLLHGGENLDISQSQSLLSADSMFSSGATTKTATKVDHLPNDGLQDLLESVNDKWSLTPDIVWEFVEALLRPGKFSPEESSYTQYQWPEHVKTMAVRVLVNFDESLTEHATSELEAWRSAVGLDSRAHLGSPSFDALPELLQSIFELHLDVYSLIKQTNSGVEQDTVVAQGDRLQRWSDLAREAIVARREAFDLELDDRLNVRFLWATTFTICASASVPQDHALECMHDLRRVLVAAGEPVIYLQNNAIMPEVSVDALDRELSKLTTKDFFLKVTSQNVSDPASVIESLEPLLEALDSSDSAASPELDQSDNAPRKPNIVPAEVVRFLEASPISVRLMLWQRLRDAYAKIEYKPMVVRCYLRLIGMVLEEMKSPDIVSLDPAERLVTELKSLRLISEWVTRLFGIVQSNPDALECMDEEYVRFAVNSFGELLQLIQVFNIVGDAQRYGKSEPPYSQNGLPLQSYRSVMKLTHETQVRVWILLYAVFKDAMSQHRDLFPTPTEDNFDFLRAVHRNLGLRAICSTLNRTFVRMLKDEFFSMTHVEGYDTEQAQVLYDLYGLNCFTDPNEMIEHECTRDAFLDRGVALQTVDLLLAQASKLTMKELVKHSLKDTIEKVHGALARKKPTESILRNREIIHKYLKSHIQPLDLYACLKGEGNQLAVNSVPEGDAVLASKGWFFLMGHMSLTKFRSQKRSGATPTEDVDIAIAFFMQDLEFTLDHWETWFRLAQAYDTKIEESVLWSAEKMNNSMQDIVALQKNAIHCFAMATALAYRSADLRFETSSKMTELYSDFALRLYASSREPFSMKPFDADDENIFISNNRGVHRSTSLKAIRLYTVWKMASVLFKRALAGRPEQWQLHYMIGKCLWKMHSANEQMRGHDKSPDAAHVVEHFVKALELLPDKDKKETKDSKREPILEPHYKLLSIVNKLWQKGSIDPASMQSALEHSHYARKEEFPDDMAEWRSYLLAVLKSLRSADKSNWYHRMIARHAQIVYNDNRQNADVTQEQLVASALAAKEVLTAQMFTKTMVLQVWRPENERAGRHFVYTTRYTRLIIQIFKQLRDRGNLEGLARRVRRRQNDLFEQSLVWHDICTAWLKLLREHANLSEGLETSCFSNIAHEDFEARKEPLEKWMQETANGASPTLDVLREVHELKKINQGLMKPGAIDDLIGDAYAHLFSTVGKQLWETEDRQRKEEQASKAAEPAPIIAGPVRNHAMSLSNLMNVDGAADVAPTPTPVITPAEPDAAPARRKVGVGRREIRNHAELCTYKGSTVAGKDQLGCVDTAPKAASASLEQDRRSSLPDGAAMVEHSAPGSVHDDADDESELSDLEERDDDEDDQGDQEELEGSSPLPELTDVPIAAIGEQEPVGADV
ncbi:Putative histone transcription regulator 3/CABIN1 [Septoria linicola]|uniref:Histone transcription regulator 3 homolog n=1 Tax=Septoria linicola TaxID=215465 RepID=A0A9Q9B0D9_9PEZI|nr:putative histone transcription regulator 3/CABIN1 [Septoria linicola]USW55318.1 Putative histone transcription regulator 3/CABIN1 [Septoria linicola]